jgi:hypothetical protein
VLEPDLANPVSSRWPAFSPPAIEAGARAVFGFPLQLGAARLGALNLCRDRPGPLSDDQHADALAMAGIAAQSVLVLQAGAPPGELAAELEESADFHYVVHQAAGMVSVQLDVSVGQALVRLRAYAFGNDRPLSEVAKEVVERDPRLRFGWGRQRPRGVRPAVLGSRWQVPGRDPRNIRLGAGFRRPGGATWPVS